MNAMRRIRYATFGILLVIAGGTLGIHCTEGIGLLDSLYFTVITLTTVGYGDIAPHSAAAKVVSVITILSGVIAFGVLVGSLTEVVVEGQVRRVLGRRKLEKDIAALKDHFIVCGFGRIGSIVCREFHRGGVPFVVVEHEADAAARADAEGYLYFLGDATDDDDLAKAGILRARGVVAVLASDADNVYVTMSARVLNKNLIIVARGEDERTSRKLARAGATRVISPYEIGGLRMAHAILRPNVIDFIEAATGAGTGINMEEIRIRAGSPLAGKTLVDSRIRPEFGLIIVAIRKPDGRMTFNPSHMTAIEAGDVLITMGPEQDQHRLAKVCG